MSVEPPTCPPLGIVAVDLPPGTAVLGTPEWILPPGEDLIEVSFQGGAIVARVNPRAHLRQGSVVVVKGVGERAKENGSR